MPPRQAMAGTDAASWAKLCAPRPRCIGGLGAAARPDAARRGARGALRPELAVLAARRARRRRPTPWWSASIAESAERLGLPEKISDWPRNVHARLIERLAAAGASVIVFDVHVQPAARARAGSGSRAGDRRRRPGGAVRVPARGLPPAAGRQRARLAGLLAAKQRRPPLPELVGGGRRYRAVSPAARAPTGSASSSPSPRVSASARPCRSVALQRHALPALADWTRAAARRGRAGRSGRSGARAGAAGAAAAPCRLSMRSAARRRSSRTPNLGAAAARRGSTRGAAGWRHAPSARRPDRALRRAGQPLSRLLRSDGPGPDACRCIACSPATERAAALPDLAGRWCSSASRS